MPSFRRLTPSRLTTIYKRQENPTWGSDYVPSILAARGEAPSISNAFTVRSSRFGRLIHLLSLPELSAFLLAAYHPALVGFQEQRMLSSAPCCHPLSSLPGVVAASLPPLKGIIDVADRLGYLSRLPKVRVAILDQPGQFMDVVFPYIGDFLLALRDEGRSTYCVNWSIKADEAGFKRPIGASTGSMFQQAEGILMRHEIERTYYADAGIRTYFVASDVFDVHVIHNLRYLYRYQQFPLELEEEERREMEFRFHSCLHSELPISELLPRLLGNDIHSLDSILTCLYQAIWQRRLRVDLFRPILIDRPLKPETKDILEVYGHLFQREGVCK